MFSLNGVSVYGTEVENPPIERRELITFFNWIRKTPIGVLAFHPRNEGERTGRDAAIEASEGLTAGVSDIIIPGRITFVCEMKRRVLPIVYTEGQMTYLLAAVDAGAFACIGLGSDGAARAVRAWSKIVGIVI